MAETTYASNACVEGHYKVTFIVNETGAKLVRGFESPYLARNFVNKLKRSKKCTLVSYPCFRE